MLLLLACFVSPVASQPSIGGENADGPSAQLSLGKALYGQSSLAELLAWADGARRGRLSDAQLSELLEYVLRSGQRSVTERDIFIGHLMRFDVGGSPNEYADSLHFLLGALPRLADVALIGDILVSVGDLNGGNGPRHESLRRGVRLASGELRMRFEAASAPRDPAFAYAIQSLAEAAVFHGVETVAEDLVLIRSLAEDPAVVRAAGQGARALLRLDQTE